MRAGVLSERRKPQRQPEECRVPVISIQTLNTALSGANARWQARQTPHSNFTDGQKKSLLGAVVNPAHLAAAMAAPARAAAPGAPPPPAEVDWRNRNGNHVPPVQDQKFCGSCVSFGTTALVSSICSVEKGEMPDLSEADLHFCSSHGASCAGWSPETALGQVQSRGVLHLAAFPYMTAFDSPPKIDPNTDEWLPHCHAAPDRSTAVKIGNWSTIADVTERKRRLANVGPCTCVLHVFDDFYSYSSGVYHHVSGADKGTHCVEVIGYSDPGKFWICKNSWGVNWGEGGYFCIAYGEAGIDTEFPFWTASGVSVPATRGRRGWESLGGVITSRPSAVSWGPNRIDVVARGADCAAWHRWWDGAAWRGWESLGGGLQSEPAICSWSSGRLDMFAVGYDHRMYHKWFDGHWSNWESLGGLLSSGPAAVSWSKDRIDLFARGMDMAMWRLWWDGHGWHGWESLGGGLSSGPGVASWGANRLDLFARGYDMHMWHKAWDGAHWSNWENLGGILADSPAAVSWAPNRIDCFYPGQNQHMWHKWWDGSHWSGEEDLGGVLSSGVGVSSWQSGRLDCFVEGTDSGMYHKWFS
jgi:C1A family cysteine protease